MKKLICALILTAMLCGCGNSESASISDESLVTENNVIQGCDGDEDISATYNTLRDFRVSTFYSNIIKSGCTPYVLEYDEERYTFEKIISNAGFYMFILNDNVTDKEIHCTITYDTYVKNISQLQEIFPYENNILTTAERDGEVYDVYLITSQYDEIENYSLSYLPYAGYEVSISAGDDSTADEILSYFNEFTLVPDEGDA